MNTHDVLALRAGHARPAYRQPHHPANLGSRTLRQSKAALVQWICLIIILSGFGLNAEEHSRVAIDNDPDRVNPNRGRPRAVANEVLVGFRPGAASRATEVRNQIGAHKLKEWPGLRAEQWRLPAGWDLARAIEVLSRNPNIEYAEPNEIYEAADFPSAPPNDAYRGELWGLHNVGQTGGSPGADIGARAAWAQQTGSDAVVVAVIDSGVEYTHPDLAANIWINPGETPNNGIDDDGNGYVDDIMGWDFVNGDNDPMDDNGHGTHVAGTIGALGNNGIGVIGVSPMVRIMPLKFLNGSGFGDTANAVSAVLYAAAFRDQQGQPLVRISNNSWGGGSKSRTLENAIKHNVINKCRC